MATFSLDHLTDTEFEHYSFDLLNAIGFKNVSWRKGTGLSASPADQGRDIECAWEVTEPGGRKATERWFVQCKHYQKGVPPDKISDTLAWAMAERPDKVLYVVSNFLSNPAKDFIENYKRNNRPPFRIVVWERPDLERLTSTRLEIVSKYRTGGDLSYLAILHPAHVAFLKTLPNFSLQRLFSLMDLLEEQQREHLSYFTRLVFLNPQFDHEHQTVGELVDKKASYKTFKEHCLNASNIVPSFVIASWIVTSILTYALVQGDTTTDIQRIVEANEDFAEKLSKRLDGEPQNRMALENVIEMHRGKAKSAKEDAEHSHALYCTFCDTVIGTLVAGEKVEEQE